MNTEAQNSLRRLMRRWDKVEGCSRAVSVASVANLAYRVEELMQYSVGEREQTQKDFRELMAVIGIGEES